MINILHYRNEDDSADIGNAGINIERTNGTRKRKCQVSIIISAHSSPNTLHTVLHFFDISKNLRYYYRNYNPDNNSKIKRFIRDFYRRLEEYDYSQ